MIKSYEERMKERGYTDKMLELDSLMDKVDDDDAKVRIIDCNDVEYIGQAGRYRKGDDEEDGFSTLSIYTEDKGDWCLGVNEIKSIEVLE